MFLKRTWALINYVIGEYGRDNCNQLAAAISYYVLFSIVPFTLFTVSVFGVVIGKEKLQRDVAPSIVDFVGLRQGTPTIEVDQSKVSSRLGPAVASQLTTAATNLTAEEAAGIANQLKENASEPVFAVVFFAGDFFAEDLLVAVFFAAVFFAADFFADVFFAVAIRVKPPAR